ncbi:hypothetical protein GPECTOR_31g396 [Gonium pectorale]|uniref:Ankyrin repeat domain-containing protein n=1 Tax=Gonium pectorale TaxID=33097 RepID=A0A150GDW6_GONPE|nr:hypothetical protein GPECTOR_31g396 [Gonium pectorale]|eukprot:KXZ48032.1 hypothetical protein GPECTOR_31g396 [Gonium pectorale]
MGNGGAQADYGIPSSDPSRIWLPELVDRIARFMPSNDAACSLRLVDRATAAQLRWATTLHLSQPVPPPIYAARWSAPGAMRGLTFDQRLLLLRLTAASGVVPNLRLALDAAGVCLTVSHKMAIFESAAAAGALPMCRWLLLHGYPASVPAMRAAARAGQLGACELLLSSGITWSLENVWSALRGGHPGLADWLLLRRASGPLLKPPQAAPPPPPPPNLDAPSTAGVQPPPPASCSRAASPSPAHLSTCQRLLEAAAEGCGLPALQALFRRCLGDGMEAAVAASRAGGAAAGATTCGIAGAGGATGGSLAAATTSGIPEEEQTPSHYDYCWRRILPSCYLSRLQSAAARSSTPDWRAKLQWLEVLEPEEGYDRQRADCTAAAAAAAAAAACTDSDEVAGNGSGCGAAVISRLDWLRGRGYRVDPDGAAAAAADVGAAAALQRLLAAGARPLEGCAGFSPVAAARAGFVEVLAALAAHGVPLRVADVAVAAAERGQLGVVQWAVRELGAEPRAPLLVLAAAGSGSVALIAWLDSAAGVGGCRWTEDAFAAAAGSGCEEALEWLAERGCPMGARGEPYLRAARNGDLGALRCLARLGCPPGPPGDVFSACLYPPHGPLPLPALRCLVEAARCPRRAGGAGYRGVHAPVETRMWVAEQLRERRAAEAAADAAAVAAAGERGLDASAQA